jgi:hypothetical protein
MFKANTFFKCRLFYLKFGWAAKKGEPPAACTALIVNSIAETVETGRISSSEDCMLACPKVL